MITWLFCGTHHFDWRALYAACCNWLHAVKKKNFFFWFTSKYTMTIGPWTVGTAMSLYCDTVSITNYTFCQSRKRKKKQKRERNREEKTEKIYDNNNVFRVICRLYCSSRLFFFLVHRNHHSPLYFFHCEFLCEQKKNMKQTDRIYVLTCEFGLHKLSHILFERHWLFWEDLLQLLQEGKKKLESNGLFNMFFSCETYTYSWLDRKINKTITQQHSLSSLLFANNE